MITRIDIQGYKSIADQQVVLYPINLLIGGNGTGKSNFISVFSLIRQVYEQQLAAYVMSKGGANRLLHMGRKQTAHIALDLHFGGSGQEADRLLLELAEAQDNLYIESLSTAHYQQGAWHVQPFEQHVKETSFRNQRNDVSRYLSEFDVYHFHDTSDSSPIKQMSKAADHHRLRRDGSNLAAFLYALQESAPKHFRRIEQMVRSVAPFFERFDLQPNAQGYVRLVWLQRQAPDAYFDAYDLSDGTLRFICLATLLMQPHPPKTILIDEPELGLHPVAIVKLGALIRKAAAQGVQLIISTQSASLVDEFAPEDILVAERQGHATVFGRLDAGQLASWLSSYSLGEIWEKSVIGGQPSLIMGKETPNPPTT